MTGESHPKDGWPLIAFASVAGFETWLEEHHGDETGLWLKIAKKASGIASITYAEAVDVALCFGWIDGQRNSFDGDYFLQRFTPRRARSIWSKVNTEKVTVLTASGRMRPGGQAQVDRAKADGRWDAAYTGSARRWCRRTCSRCSTRTRPLLRSTRRSARRTSTPSRSGCRQRSDPRPARSGSPRWPEC